MQQSSSQCTDCGAFPRRSLHHEEVYQSSALFERLRTSNFPANEKEIMHIRHTILPTVSNDILSIDFKITSLQEVIRLMEDEREWLINVQKKYSNLISLRRTLPSEIWSAIFVYTHVIRYNALYASNFVWQFSRVCLNWRNIALSLQLFWSTMCIRFPEKREADAQRLETVLQRSRQGLLDVSLSDGSDRADE
ncbi:hypothetical protein CPB85DRAFT_925485 [Mucidula mucida]|nr:hypothetical protein CPB85DRAFT_260071 [Mucidula mucida]KAF8905340.1 hypothetical protein CPB85DRAFT_925485 [Mucidula mucida]